MGLVCFFPLLQVLQEMGLDRDLELGQFVSNPRVTDQLLPGHPLRRVFLEQASQHVVKVLTETFNPGRRCPPCQLNNLCKISRNKGRIPLPQLIQHAPKCPQITLETIDAISLEQLRCHI